MQIRKQSTGRAFSALSAAAGATVANSMYARAIAAVCWRRKTRHDFRPLQIVRAKRILRQNYPKPNIAMNKPFLAGIAALVLGGCFSVNDNIEIGDGVSVERSLNTVNGRVTVGRDTTVKGNVRTVNGAVEIGADSVVGEVQTVNGKVEFGDSVRADSVEAVNGSVEFGEGVEVDDQVETVNGRVVIGRDSVVGGRVESVNGQIRLVGATVGSLRNRRGGMLLEAGSRVLGELRVTKGGARERNDPVLVEIHADCEVVGPLVFERPVRLRIHESAEIGEIQGAEPEYFSG